MQQFAQKRAFCVDFLSACQCDVELLLNLQQLQFKVLVCRHGLGDQAVGALHRLMIPRKAGRGKRILLMAGRVDIPREAVSCESS